MKDAVEPTSSPKWLKQIVRSFEKSEDKLPEPEFLKGDFPDWVQNVARELLSTLFPEARLKPGAAWTPAEVGALVGHKAAYLHAIVEFTKVQKRGAFKKLDRRALAQMQKRVQAFVEAINAATINAVSLASQRPYNEAVGFFTAFAKGLARMPSDMDASNFHRTNTRVYFLLLRGWPSVERLRSVRELQQALCRYLEPACSR